MQGRQIPQIVLGGACIGLGLRLLTMDMSEHSKQEALAYKAIGIGGLCIGVGNMFLAFKGNGGHGDDDNTDEIVPDPDGGDELPVPSENHLEDTVPDNIDELLVGSDNG